MSEPVLEQSQKPFPIVVLISGSGSNLQAIIDTINKKVLPIEIKAVISNEVDAYGLQRASKAGIATKVVSHKDYYNDKGKVDREQFDLALQQAIDSFDPELVVLAGFMRILTDAFVNHYVGKMINIHPSLLPKFQGLHTHQRAIEANEKEHGVTVHFVTPELDGGPSILQARVAVLADDTAASLAKRVLEFEHQIYPTVIEWFATGRLQMHGNQIEFDGQTLDTALQYNQQQ